MTTQVPVSMLSPAGSVAGQVPTSNGPTSPLTWASQLVQSVAGRIGAIILAKADVGLANVDNTSDINKPVSTAQAAADALKANAANAALTGTTTVQALTATGLIAPAPLVGIKGTTTNDAVQAGSVGEFPTPTNLTGVPLTVFVTANTSSISLSAGNWLVQGGTAFTPAGSTVVQSLTVGLSTTSATLGAAGTYSVSPGNPTAGSGNPVVWTPLVDIKLASTTTVYCVASSNFSASTMAAGGFIRAWRLR